MTLGGNIHWNRPGASFLENARHLVGAAAVFGGVVFLNSVAFAQEMDPLDEFAPADLVFINGKVVTVDKAFSVAEAVAVKGNKITAVGKKEDIEKLVGSETKKIDLQGKTLLPGINDSHLHFQWMATGKSSPVLKMGQDKKTTKAQDKAAMINTMKRLNAMGITSLTDPGLNEEYISILRELHKEGKLTVRISTLWCFSQRTENDNAKFQAGMNAAGPYKGSDNDWFNVIGLKIGADNLPNDKTSWMLEDYKTGGNGKLYYPGSSHSERAKAMNDMIAKAHSLGYQVGVHATGDQSIKTLVECYAKLEKEQPKGLRHYIIHGDYTSLEAGTIKTMAEYNISVAGQPGLAMMVGHGQEANLKADVFARFTPIKSLMSAGVHVSGGSDAPIIDPDWKVGIQSAITRKAGKGSGMFKGPFSAKQLGPDQAVSIKDAIRMYTCEGAWLEKKDQVKGSIEVGKLADFCVVEGDLLGMDSSKIQDAKVVMTVVDGKVAHGGQLDGE